MNEPKDFQRAAHEGSVEDPLSPHLSPDPYEDQTAKAVPIEVKWNLPAWMLRDPGPAIDVEDDDIDFQ